jgi:arylsulfatase A-like enzyme
LLTLCGIGLTSDVDSPADAPPTMTGINLLDERAVAGRKQLFGEIFLHSAADVDDPSSSVRYRWTREGSWKLIVPDARNEPKAVVELYDLAADPGETKNLAATEPERVARLTSSLDAWWNPTAAADEGAGAERKAP